MENKPGKNEHKSAERNTQRAKNAWNFFLLWFPDLEIRVGGGGGSSGPRNPGGRGVKKSCHPTEGGYGFCLESPNEGV